MGAHVPWVRPSTGWGLRFDSFHGVGGLHGVNAFHGYPLPWVRPREEKATLSAQTAPEWKLPPLPFRSILGSVVAFLHGPYRN